MEGDYRGFTGGVEGDYRGISWGYADGLGLRLGGFGIWVVERVTPCAPLDWWLRATGAHGVTRPAMRTTVKPFEIFFSSLFLFAWLQRGRSGTVRLRLRG